MGEEKRRARLTETILGRMIACALAVGWIVTMAIVDGNAYTAFPLCLLTILVALGFGVGLLRGDKIVRLTWVGWMGLGVGVYYVVRALMSYSTVEGWGQASLVLACMVYYVAGMVAAQGRMRVAMGALAGAVLLNVVYFYLIRYVGVDIVWTGRPEVSLTGENSLPWGLFYYKNFGGLFLALGGVLLLVRCMSGGFAGMGKWLVVLLSLTSMVLACCCQTVSPLGVGLALMVMGGCVWVVQRMHVPGRVGIIPLIVGAILITLLGITSYSLMYGDLFTYVTQDLDTHLRFQIWGDLVRVVQEAPLWGYGAGASQWEIVPFFDEWVTPNYAHNEYLQAWVDYGLLGLLMVFAVLACHVVAGFWTLGSEETDSNRREASALALLTLAALIVCAISDYVWHHPALAMMTAFACGILASPFPHARLSLPWRRKWAEDSRQAELLRVRSAGVWSRCLLGLATVGLLITQVFLAERFLAPWMTQWRFRPVAELDASAMDAQCQLAAKLLPGYPDFLIMNYCARGLVKYQVDWDKHIPALSTTLRGNPRNLFNVVMLADALMHTGRFADAELLMRRFYSGDGPDSTCLSSWTAYYGMNLLCWGLQDCCTGKPESGVSKLRYAVNISQHASLTPNTAYRKDRTWVEASKNPHYRNFLQFCREQADFLESIGVSPDDSWMQPMEPGGKSALYQRWGLDVKKK